MFCIKVFIPFCPDRSQVCLRIFPLPGLGFIELAYALSTGNKWCSCPCAKNVINKGLLLMSVSYGRSGAIIGSKLRLVIQVKSPRIK